MAQKSKKEHIVEAALPLFLEHGFKATSIDMVVRASRVSKPTVYNHFPDKAALMLAVMTRWVEANKPALAPIRDADELEAFLREHWLTDEAVRLYALVIGEGFRFPPAKRLFWEQFDLLWRSAAAYLGRGLAEIDETTLELRLDRRLVERLRAQ